MITDRTVGNLLPSQIELIELSDDELDALSGGSHHHRHHHGHHHGHGSAITHAGNNFYKRSLSISAQTTTGPNGTMTTFSIDLIEITSHSEQI